MSENKKIESNTVPKDIAALEVMKELKQMRLFAIASVLWQFITMLLYVFTGFAGLFSVAVYCIVITVFIMWKQSKIKYLSEKYGIR